MTINFYLNNEEETEITSFNELVSNPFKLGETISLDVKDLYPKDFEGFPNREFREKMMNENDELKNKFRLKEVTLVKELKFVDFSKLGEPKLSIDYYCEFSD